MMQETMQQRFERRILMSAAGNGAAAKAMLEEERAVREVYDREKRKFHAELSQMGRLIAEAQRRKFKTPYVFHSTRFVGKWNGDLGEDGQYEPRFNSDLEDFQTVLSCDDGHLIFHKGKIKADPAKPSAKRAISKSLARTTTARERRKAA